MSLAEAAKRILSFVLPTRFQRSSLMLVGKVLTEPHDRGLFRQRLGCRPQALRELAGTTADCSRSDRRR